MREHIENYIDGQLNIDIWHGKIEEILLSDEKFIEDLDSFPNLLMSEKFKGKTIDEMKDFLHHAIIGNTCRNYILNVLAVKHLYRILREKSIFELDDFWQTRLDNFLLHKIGQGNTLFDKMKIEQTLNLIKTLLMDDDNFIKLFEKVFCKEGSVNKENIVKIATSLLTDSPEYEYAVTLFVFKYITNALEGDRSQFDDKEWLEMLEKICDLL